MMDDALVEIDTARLAVSRHFIVARGREAGGPGAPVRASGSGVARRPWRGRAAAGINGLLADMGAAVR